MTKSNKELAIDVAIEYIRANPRLVYRKNQVTDGIVNTLELKSVNNIIKSVSKTLDEIDKAHKIQD